MVLIFSIFLSCLKQTELSKAASAVELSTIAVIDDLQAQQSIPLPKELQESINKTLSSRNINSSLLPIPTSFQEQRLSEQRLKTIERYPTLLIETKALFYSQLNGRFRWEVQLHLTLAHSADQRLQRQRTIPVFHQFHHQREEEALLAAETTILREMNLLIDDYLRGQQLL